MANTKSAKKAIRVSARKNVSNLRLKRNYKKAQKDLAKAVSEGASTPELLSSVYKSIDKATKNKVLHKNTAARLKSRLTKKTAKK